MPTPPVFAQVFHGAPPPPHATARHLLDPVVAFLEARLPHSVALHSHLTLFPLSKTTLLLSTLDVADLTASRDAPAKPFAIACWDRTHHPAPEAFLFTSLDVPSMQASDSLVCLEDAASSEAEDAILPHTLALIGAMQSSPFHHSPGPSKLYPEITVTIDKHAAFGAVPLPTLHTLQNKTTLLCREPGTYPKVVFQLPEYTAEQRTADQTRIASLGLEFSTIEPRDYQLIYDNNDIVRLVGTAYLKDQPCLALRRKDTATLAAWVLVRPDGSIGGLTTLDGFQRKGLAALCIRKALGDVVRQWKQDHGLNSAPTVWKHADVKRTNTPSWDLFTKLGAVQIMHNSWFAISLHQM